jgi:hypothetical protein
LIPGFWLLRSAFDGLATVTIMTREKPGKIDNDQKPRKLRDIIDAVDTSHLLAKPDDIP